MHRRERVPDGTRVRIREWEDMGRDFGDPGMCDASFVDEMREFCGEIFTVRYSHPTTYWDNGHGVNSYDYYFEEGNNGFIWTADMFDIICVEEDDDVAEEEINLTDLFG